MRLLKNILLFQKKIVFTSYIISIPIAILFKNINVVGVSVMFVMLMLHFFIYELKNQDEYFYYYNLGITKLQLWFSTLFIGFINVIIFTFL